MKPKNRKHNTHLLKSHDTIIYFAFRKRVYTTSVYSAIDAGKIIPDIVGTSKTIMFDLRKYGTYKFQVRNPDKSALTQWYICVGYLIREKKANRKAQAILNYNNRKL